MNTIALKTAGDITYDVASNLDNIVFNPTVSMPNFKGWRYKLYETNN